MKMIKTKVVQWMLAVSLLSTVVFVAPGFSQERPSAPATVNRFDPEAATEGYLAKMTAEKREKSDAYFEGGYWLQLWNVLIGAGVAALLLFTRLSARMRDLAARITKRKPIQTALYWIEYALFTTVILFPMTAYEGYFREHKYGLATQTFGPWLGDQAKGLLISLILGALFMPLLYGIIRKLPRTWWLWGAVATMVMMVFILLIGPVFIDPLFNKYTKLEDPRVREPILRLARANGIEVNDIMVFDASRQTTRVSANVSGFMGTERIALNDNLLNKCTLPEIEYVMAHEMGHYVLHHIYKMLLVFLIVMVVCFAFLKWGFDWFVKKWGVRTGVSAVGDIAGLPLLFFFISLFMFVFTPILNSYIRINEVEADRYGLNAARQPDGMAEAALKLAEYRKMSPGKWEEIIFYDHPSGRNRILMAMKWKSEMLEAGYGYVPPTPPAAAPINPAP